MKLSMPMTRPNLIDRGYLAASRFVASAVGLVALLLFVVPQAQASDAKSLNGVALVIGQSEYVRIPALPNPANDAREIVKLLTDLGFDARSVSDRDAKKLTRDLERFVEDAEGADVAFLYYSGHGIEAGGENWLVPVDADAESLTDAREKLVSVTAVIEDLAETVPVAIVLLDACRTSPFPPGSVLRQSPTGSAAPITTDGLTPVRGARAIKASADASESLGQVIGFAAEPGRPALDGPTGANSPYAKALLRHLAAMQGAEFGAVMRMVTEEVYLETAARQRPWINESLRRFLYFGVAPKEPEGDDALITGERRRLLLTISELPDASRTQVETVALKDEVPLGALYGVLKAMGAERMPEDPDELENVLLEQAERLKGLIGQREALRSDEPEIQRLSASADRAIREGAIETARRLLDDAVARVEETGSAVDEAEDLIRSKRIADAAVYARRAEASALAFDYLAAARDFGKARELVEKWDETLRWNYANGQAEALQAHGVATGDRASLDTALEVYRAILDLIPRGEEGRDWAITRNNMAVVHETLGEREEGTGNLEEAAAIFADSLEIFRREKDDLNWAAAQNNLGNVLLKLGQRERDRGKLEQAVAAFRAAQQKRPRDTAPLEWASGNNNIGIALYSLAEREAGPDRLREAEAAYRLALEEYTRERAPVQWAMVQNNLGNTLLALGSASNDPAKIAEAAAAFRAALQVRTREHFPLSWATSRLNLGNALAQSTRFDLGTDVLEEAAAALRDALTIYTRSDFPLDWAAAQNNLGSLLQTLGQRRMDRATLEEAVSAFRAAQRIYDRRSFALDHAMTRYNLGNTQQLLAAVTGEPRYYREAISNFRGALAIYGRDTAPKQWALAQAGLGSALQYLANTEDGTGSLEQSIQARRTALQVLSIDDAPVDWANAQNGLAMSLINLGTRERTGRYLDEARAALEASLRVFTREKQPLQWAFGQNNLGDVEWNRATLGGGKPAFEQARSHFALAKQGFAEAGYLAAITLTDKKIELIDQALAKR